MPKEENGYWFSTENGTHIHAEEGESKESAMKKKFSNFGKKKESWKSDEDAIWEKFNKGEITEEERNKYLSERSSKVAKKDTTFEEINEKRMSGKAKKHDYSEIFDEDYQRSWGIPNFKDENDIKTLNDIVEKAMEYDGEEGAIDISNNAMERIEQLVKFTPEEQDKIATGTGEEIMDILRSKEKVSSGRDKELNDMIGALDKARNPEEKHELEEGIIQRENELKRSKLPKYEEGKPGEDYDFYDDGTFTTHSRKTAHSSFEEPSVAYDDLSRFYGIDLEKVIYGKGGYEEQRDKGGFQGDIIYSEKEWDKFENWLKQKHGVDLEQIRKDKFEEYKKTHTPRKRLF